MSKSRDKHLFACYVRGEFLMEKEKKKMRKKKDPANKYFKSSGRNRNSAHQAYTHKTHKSKLEANVHSRCDFLL